MTNDNGTTVVRLHIWPRWKRMLKAPRVWFAHYRILRRHNGILVSMREATFFTWLMVKT